MPSHPLHSSTAPSAQPLDPHISPPLPPGVFNLPPMHILVGMPEPGSATSNAAEIGRVAARRMAIKRQSDGGSQKLGDSVDSRGGSKFGAWSEAELVAKERVPGWEVRSANAGETAREVIATGGELAEVGGGAEGAGASEGTGGSLEQVGTALSDLPPFAPFSGAAGPNIILPPPRSATHDDPASFSTGATAAFADLLFCDDDSESEDEQDEEDDTASGGKRRSSNSGHKRWSWLDPECARRGYFERNGLKVAILPEGTQDEREAQYGQREIPEKEARRLYELMLATCKEQDYFHHDVPEFHVFQQLLISFPPVFHAFNYDVPSVRSPLDDFLIGCDDKAKILRFIYSWFTRCSRGAAIWIVDRVRHLVDEDKLGHFHGASDFIDSILTQLDALDNSGDGLQVTLGVYVGWAHRWLDGANLVPRPCDHLLPSGHCFHFRILHIVKDAQDRFGFDSVRPTLTAVASLNRPELADLSIHSLMHAETMTGIAMGATPPQAGTNYGAAGDVNRTPALRSYSANAALGKEDKVVSFADLPAPLSLRYAAADGTRQGHYRTFGEMAVYWQDRLDKDVEKWKRKVEARNEEEEEDAKEATAGAGQGQEEGKSRKETDSADGEKAARRAAPKTAQKAERDEHRRRRQAEKRSGDGGTVSYVPRAPRMPTGSQARASSKARPKGKKDTAKGREKSESEESGDDEAESDEDGGSESAKYDPTARRQCLHCPARPQNKHYHQHLRKQHGIAQLYSCPRNNCTKSFNRARQLEGHLNFHDSLNPPRNVTCWTCEVVFSGASGARRHNREQHGV
ncbi:hypothetical protein JCM11641_004696 [Rhodosporidiobolus odoratus]